MSPSKKDRSKGLLLRLPGVGLLRDPHRSIVLGAAVLVLFAGLWVWGWSRVRSRVLASDVYWVKLENIETTPLPPWIRIDVRAEVFRDASLDRPLSILDDDLTDRIAAAFKLHPWIAEVRQVRKYHPARVKVDLVYRQPVLMVQVPAGLLPVDVQGIFLPTEGLMGVNGTLQRDRNFSSLEAGQYPRLVGVDTAPVALPGERWGDARVVGAAEIAAAFGPAWQRLGLDRIVPVTVDVSAERNREETYELFTRGGTRILWGRAPSTNMPGEIPAEEKVARLEKFVSEHGMLDGPKTPKEINIRGLQAVQTLPRSATKPHVVHH